MAEEWGSLHYKLAPREVYNYKWYYIVRIDASYTQHDYIGIVLYLCHKLQTCAKKGGL